MKRGFATLLKQFIHVVEEILAQARLPFTLSHLQCHERPQAPRSHIEGGTKRWGSIETRSEDPPYPVLPSSAATTCMKCEQLLAILVTESCDMKNTKGQGTLVHAPPTALTSGHERFAPILSGTSEQGPRSFGEMFRWAQGARAVQLF